jgi:carboxyl-terminal processing protease
MVSEQSIPNPRAFGVLVGLIVLAFITLGFTFPGGAGGGRVGHYFALPFEALVGAQSRPSDQDGGPAEIDPTNAYQALMGDLNKYYYWKDKVKTDELTEAAIRGALAALDDPYTRFLNKDEWREMSEENRGEFFGIGATVTLPAPGRPTIDWVIEGNPADVAGLKSGDVILAVKDFREYTKVTKSMLLTEVVDKIKGPEGTPVTLTVERTLEDEAAKKAVVKPDTETPGKETKPETKTLDITITRARIEYPVIRVRKPEDWEKYGLENPEKYGIGYVRIVQFNQRTDQKLMEEIEKIQQRLGNNFKGLIIDVRGNPGGLLSSAVAVSQRFVAGKQYDNVIVSVKEGHQTEEHQHKASESRLIRRELGVDPKIAVLVNRDTASGAEILAGAIQDYGAGKLIGERTFGKGLVQTLYQLPPRNETAVAVTTAVYYTPSHYSISEEGGIVPDITVKLDEKQPMKDLQAEKAIEVLRAEIEQPTAHRRPSPHR